MARCPWTSAALRALAAMAVMGFAGAARAQIVNAVYEDARDVIEDLIQREVAEAVAPNLACRTVRLRDTDQHLRAYAEIVAKLETTPDGPERTALNERRAELKRSIQRGFPILTYFPLTLQRIFRRQLSAIRTSVADEAAGFAGHMVFIGLTSSEARMREPQGAQGTALLLKFASDDNARAEGAAPKALTWTKLDAALLNTCISVLKEDFAAGLTAAGAQSPLEQSCGPSAASDTRYACELAFAVRAVLLRKDALAEEHFIRAVAVVVGEIAATTLGAGSADIRAKLLDEAILVTRDVLRGGKRLDEVVPVLVAAAAAPGSTGPGTADPADATAAVLRAKLSDLERLQTQWNISTRDGASNLDIVSFVNVIGAPGGSLRKLCDENLIEDVCAQIRNQSTALTSIGELKADLWPAIRLASQGEYGEAATRAVRTFFSARFGGDDDQVHIYRRFAESVIVYVLATAGDRGPSDADRATFREAAVEVLRELGTRGGMDRRWGDAFYRPDLALRVSWSPSYAGGGAGSPRIVPSATLANLRVVLCYSDAYYLALQQSFIDPLAPLSELALRRTEAVTYEDTSRVLLNAVTPRFEVMVGVPALSKHLVVTGGASLRLAAPFEKKEQATCNGACYRYKYLWNERRDIASDASWLGFIEFGFALKYLL